MKIKSEEPIIKIVKMHEDPRGWFAELMRSEELKNKTFGQISLTVAKKNQNKGGHYHKVRYEWFIVIKGKIEMSLQHISTGEKKVIEITSTSLQSLCVPPLWFHTIKSLGDDEETMVLLYSSITYDPKNPDTYTDL